jgi:hypothetical protein
VRGAALLLLALLAACAAAPELRAVAADAGSVTYRYAAGKRDEAERQAALYCANLGRTAVLRRVISEEGAGGVAEFECR